MTYGDPLTVTPLAFVGGENYAKRQVDLNDASKELARFLSGGNSPTKDDIEGARESLDPPSYRGVTDVQGLKNSAVTQQADRMYEKIQQYNSEWSDALPSASWKKPLPGWSQNNESTYQTLANGGKTPAVSVSIPNGPTISFPNQEAADAFKKEHGVQ